MGYTENGQSRANQGTLRFAWEACKLVALPHFAWSRPTSVSYQVTDPKMESALACLAVYDTLAEAIWCKVRSGLQRVIRSRRPLASTQSAGEPNLWGAGVIGWVPPLRNGGELIAQLAARRDHPTTLHALQAYIETNEGALIDYGQRSRAGKPISTSRIEGTVNQLVSARMNKRQQMRWSPLGAHRVLQVRAAVLDGRFGHQAIQLAA